MEHVLTGLTEFAWQTPLMLPVVCTVALLAFTGPHAVLRVRSSRSAIAAMSIQRPRSRTGGGVPRPLRFQLRDRSMPSWFNMGAQDPKPKPTKASGKTQNIRITLRRRAAPPAVPPPAVRLTPPRECVPPLLQPENTVYPEYWYDPRIHTFGNIGLGGRFHALLAPISTHMIDRLAYNGTDVRKVVKDKIPRGASVLDLCCGTGFSTSSGAVGVDTSDAMLDMARLRRLDCKFYQGNAETYGETDSFDVVTVMFATHEMPAGGRRRVLRNAARIARQSVILVDISPDYADALAKKPLQGASFLAGEPYVLDYLRRIDYDIRSAFSSAWSLTRSTLIPGHVTSWKLDVNNPPSNSVNEPSGTFMP